MNEIILTKENFDKEINSDIPILVDFWASWCGPCRAFAPTIEEFAKRSDGKYKVGKLNIDDEEDIAERYNVMSIPTIKVFRNGQVVSTHVGALPIAKLQELVGS